MTSYDKLNIVDKIIRIHPEFQKYNIKLSPLLKIEDFYCFKEADLQKKPYFIGNAQDAKNIFKAIKQINKYNQSLDKANKTININKYTTSMNKAMKNKTVSNLKSTLKQECSNENCKFETCQPLNRIDIILHVYRRFMQNKSLWDELPISSIINMNGEYSHQMLGDDFLHVKIVHCESGKEKRNLCKRFNSKYPCDVEECLAFNRHYRDKNEENECSQFERKFGDLPINSYMKIINEKDAVFQQECDKIHSYFLHEINNEASRYNGPPEEEEETKSKGEITLQSFQFFRRRKSSNVLNKNNAQKFSGKQYIGRKEDEKWWNVIDDKDNKHMYFKLLAGMGVFRWQNAHGFRVGENRAVEHLKQKHSNIKEEALHNIYHPLSKDNWNQTLRKSKIFYQSWAKHKIKTDFKGFFDDKVTGQYAQWKKGIDITLQEIVILKLYTDFDKLQFALKKCFRSEDMNDIFRRNKTVEEDKQWNPDEEKLNEIDEKEWQQKFDTWQEKTKQMKNDLEQRIEEFFHWRAGLMIVLNKFGKKLNSKNKMILYHGVNTKMIIRPTETFGFYGPLSTTTSKHVARTFATAKGMVLKLTSYFPRLNYCTAFDASLISDYPEEQEWLVGFMYVRVLEVRTRRLIQNPKSFKEMLNKVPMASFMREEFFAIHLFREQMFSMNEHLERMQAQYLRANRMECCKNKDEYKGKYDDLYIEDSSWEHRLEMLCYMAAKHHGETETKTFEEKKNEEFSEQLKNQKFKEDIAKTKILYPIFWERFQHFREYPNKSQSITFDNISDILKRFFMEPSDVQAIATGQSKWIISFDEIITVYPNVKEIHFVNNYRFDEYVLGKLVDQIQRKDNVNKLKKVTFSYYDYETKHDDFTDSQNMPPDSITFKNPDHLEHSVLRNNILNVKPNKWKIVHKENGDVGYKITIYEM